MRRWIKLWLDWLRTEFQVHTQIKRGGFAVSILHEELGQQCDGLPIPGTAEAVIIQVLLRLPPQARRKKDLLLQFPHFAPIMAESVHPVGFDRCRVIFRFQPPRWTVHGELRWKDRRLHPITVPLLSIETFLNELSLVSPMVFVKLVDQLIPVRQFVVHGRRRVLASVVVRSAHGLGPLLKLPLTVSFRHERTGREFVVPARLTASQRAATETVVTVVCPTRISRPEAWSVAWSVGPREFAVRHVDAIPSRGFAESVCVADARFAVADCGGEVRVVRQPPAISTVDRLGPCFLIASIQPGVAGVCRLAIYLVGNDGSGPLPLIEKDTLVTDVPTPFAPVLLPTSRLMRVSGFELRLDGRIIGIASLSLVPQANLTAEGGFRASPDFTWSPAAEDELMNRLRQLGGESDRQ